MLAVRPGGVAGQKECSVSPSKRRAQRGAQTGEREKAVEGRKQTLYRAFLRIRPSGDSTIKARTRAAILRIDPVQQHGRHLEAIQAQGARVQRSILRSLVNCEAIEAGA